MSNQKNTVPDHTAVRVALWRAMHVQVDDAPHVFTDEIGLKLVAPDENWKERPDMHPQGTRGYRASIVGRARFIEDLLGEKVNQGVSQYVILGAGLDTFAQRRPDLSSKIEVFEIDMPATQAWKRQRLIDLDFGIPNHLHFVPVDFEAGDSWLVKLKASGFNNNKPAVVTSTGVAMYLTREATMATLRDVATLAPGSTFAMTFLLPLNLLPIDEQPEHQMIYERAKAAGTPIIGFYRPSEIVAMAREAGFKEAKHVSREEIIKKYFAHRPDKLAPSSGEEYLVAST